jgi:hypothetical protein
MKRQRGDIAIQLMIYALGALAVGIAIWGAVSFISNNWETKAGIKRGEENIRVMWDEANIKAQAKADAERKANERIVEDERVKALKAEGVARDYEQKWRTARDQARSKPLALASCPPQKANQPALTVEAPDVRFSWRFVRLYDSAWTGQDGKPVFGDSVTSKAASADPDGASPYGPDQVIDTHKVNAERCSAARRDLNTMMDTIERLQGK